MDLLDHLEARLSLARGPIARLAMGDGTSFIVPIAHLAGHCALLRPLHGRAPDVAWARERIAAAFFADARLWNRAAWYLWMSYTLALSGPEQAARLEVRRDSGREHGMDLSDMRRRDRRPWPWTA